MSLVKKIREIRRLRSKPEEFADLEKLIALKAKSIKHDGQPVTPSNTESASAPEFVKLPRFNPLEASTDAAADMHDGSDVEEMAAEATLPCPSPEGDTNLGLTDLEFLLHLKVHSFEEGQGTYLIDSNPALFRKVVTRLLTYREAGRFRLDYNKILPAMRGFEFDVKLKPGEEANPYDAGAKRYSEKETAEITRQVLQLMKSGILEEVRSPWAANLVLAKKAGGDLRMCVDFRELNRRCLHLASQLPQMMDVVLQSFSNGDLIFSQLDLSQAYHQLKVTEESKPFLSFKVPRPNAKRLGEARINPPFQVAFKRLPFGLTDAVTAFSIIVQEIFQPFGLSPYLDDLGFGTKTANEHLERLDLIFTLAARYGLTFGSKCALFRSRLRFLGHVVDANGIHIDEDRVKDLLLMPSPRNTTEVQNYLGCIQFCSTFLGTNLASVAAPLNDLLRSGVPWPWTQEQIARVDAAVEKLRVMLTNAPVLKLYQTGLPTMLVTDGSTRGVGAVMLQKHGEAWHPVFYLSKKLTEVQSRWNVSQFGLFALVSALVKWRIYLLDQPFLVLTDHAALTYLKGGKLFEGRRLARWQMLLSEFNFHIQHKAGIDIGLSDCLSRMLRVSEELDLTDPGSESSMVALIETLGTELSTDASTRELASFWNARSLLATTYSLVLAPVEECIAPLFSSGTRVKSKVGVWPDAVYHGTVRSQRHTGQKQKKNSVRPEETFYTVDFDDGTSFTMAEHTLELSDVPPPAVAAVPGSTTDTPEDLEPDEVNAGQPKAVEPSRTQHEDVTAYIPQAGDVVEVFIGHEMRFKDHFGKDVLVPLGVINEIQGDRIAVKLLVRTSPTLILEGSGSLSLVISRVELSSVVMQPSRESPEILVGDVVIVRQETRSSELIAKMKEEGIDVGALTGGWAPDWKGY